MYGEHTLAAWLEPRLELSPTSAVDRGAHARQRARDRRRSRICTSFIGEMVPKAIALSHAERTVRAWSTGRCSRRSGCSIRWCAALNGAGNFFLRLMGIRRQRRRRRSRLHAGRTADHRRGKRRGRRDAGRVGHRSCSELLEFGDLTAGEVMVPRVRVMGIPLDRRRQSGPRHRRSSIITRAIPSTTATSITSSACCT